MTGRALVSTLPWLLLAACTEEAGPERAQWIVSVETDAPVPELGDRLLVEVWSGESSCDGCTRHLASADPRQWPLSFGVVSAADVSVQVTLFRAALIRENGLPEGDALLEARARLPESNGPTKVSVRLPTDCFGVRASAADGTTCDPETRTLVQEPVASAGGPRLAAGSWLAAQETPCQRPAEPGTACVPGGVFLLGDAAAALVADVEELPVPERLVQISPFFLDEHELTVGEARALIDGDPGLATPSQGTDCTYRGQTFAGNDALPLNCIRRDEARALCGALGKRLPTEAEWEYAAGNRNSETPFPWGHDEDVCAHAVVARDTGIGECRRNPNGTLPRGLQAAGSSDDVTALGIRDMGGNVSEWVEDGFEPYEADCWKAPSAALLDPTCGGDGGTTAVRGGNWKLRPSSARTVRRSSNAPEARSTEIGFRCVSQ